MRVLRLQAENFKGLKAIDITPDKNVVKVTGINGQGKTSTIDCIWVAIGGKAAADDMPVRLGQESARVCIDLGDMVAERTFLADGSSTLKVTGKDGAKIASPQRVLDNLLGKVTLDPMAFARAKAKDQGETLRALVGLDLSAMDQYRKTLFDERTAENRRLGDIEGRGKAIVVPAGAPDTEVSAGELLRQISEADTYNRTTASLIAAYAQAAKTAENAEYAASNARAAAIKAHDALCVRCADTDLAPLKAQVANLEALNAAARAKAGHAECVRQWHASKAIVDALTTKIKDADGARAHVIQSAPLPVPGLGFNDDGEVTLNSIPLAQISAAEKLRVSVAVAMAGNPALRVLRISDGSLLDSASMAIVEQMAAERDYQLWIEIVDESGAVGIVIEDGTVKAINH